MKNVWLLLKVLFKQNYRKDKSSKRSKGTQTSLIASFIVLSIALLPILVILLVSYSFAAADADVGREYMSSIYFAEQTFALIFGTVLLVNTLFSSKDNAFLATLPVTSRQIFVAKILYVTFNELIYAGSLGLLASIIYGVIAKMSVVYYIMSVIAVIISPMLSLILSSILMFPLMYVFSFIKKNTTIKSVFSIGAYVIFMVGYVLILSKLYSSFSMDDMNVSAAITVFVNLGRAMFFDYALSGIVFISDGMLSNIIIVIAVWGIGIVAAYFLSGNIYKRSMAIASETDSIKLKSVKYKNTSIIKTLIIKDWKEISRDSTLLFYCFTQIIIAPLMIGLMFGVLYKEMGVMEEGLGNIMIDLVGTWLLFMFSCGTNYVGTSAITRENRHWYLMKIFPIPVSIQIRAKFILVSVFSVASAILGSLTFLFFETSPVDVILRALVIAIFSLGFVSKQIKMDIDRPRLNWTSIAEGMKSSPSMMVSMFLSMGIGLVVGITVMLGSVLPETLAISSIIVKAVIYVILIALAAVFALLNYRRLNNKAESLMNKLEG